MARMVKDLLIDGQDIKKKSTQVDRDQKRHIERKLNQWLAWEADGKEKKKEEKKRKGVDKKK